MDSWGLMGTLNRSSQVLNSGTHGDSLMSHVRASDDLRMTARGHLVKA
jgi:hypothetical protein